ncbi:sensor histidine kinase [Anaeromyxobacter diazotrophicus]|uniref:sensor histidine kinase n=1 Tax=Anaeromyxobacter diazotrophicus TaxID=2590199 RepID=UPI00158F9D6D|nr:ATP-binding protein [Anaeromyxobacter diazotrophicus]
MRIPHVERVIPWRHRIKTKLLLVTVVICVGGVTIFALAEGRMADQFFETQAAGAALFSNTIERATLRAMLENRRGDVFDTMRDIGRQEGVEGVRLLAKDGRVAYSTVEREVGTILEQRSDACRPCHAAGRPRLHAPLLERTRVFERGGRRVLGLVTPIRNEPRCATAECHVHRADEDVLGLLDVSLSLASSDARIADFRRGSLVLTGVGVLLLCSFFFAFARLHVVRPVQALVEGTRRVAGDQLDTEIRVRSKGELGLLAASFNDMTRSLRRTEGELKDLNLGLERQVEERTADLQKAQNALVHNEKMSSLGQLAASIAHEINNPLAGILTFAKLVIRTLEQGPPDDATRRDLVRNLALVQRETERCSAIVRNLLDFARDRPVALRELQVNAVVEEALQLIAHQLAIQGLTLERDLQPTAAVRADFGQLRQAVVNVALNAVEAMGKRGTLSVRTRAAADGGVEIVLADTGPGITPENLKHVFEPFFTTKEKGTGLGLSVVYGIMQRHQGRVDVQSEPGRGTTFVLALPPLGAGEGQA